MDALKHMRAVDVQPAVNRFKLSLRGLMSEHAAYRERANFAEAEVVRLRQELSMSGRFDVVEESRKRYREAGNWKMALR